MVFLLQVFVLQDLLNTTMLGIHNRGSLIKLTQCLGCAEIRDHGVFNILVSSAFTQHIESRCSTISSVSLPIALMTTSLIMLWASWHVYIAHLWTIHCFFLFFFYCVTKRKGKRKDIFLSLQCPEL